MERELLRAILLEMIYRKQSHIAAGSVFVEAPDWLIEGVLALAPGRDRGQLVEALTAADKTAPLEAFLHQRPRLLDSAGRTLYRAYSFALVQMLIDGRNGPARLTQYIGHLYNASNEPLADLKTQFPALGARCGTNLAVDLKSIEGVADVPVAHLCRKRATP